VRSNLSAIGRIFFATAFVFVVFLLFEQTHQIASYKLRQALIAWDLDRHRDPLALALERACYAIFLSGAGWLLFRRLLPRQALRRGSHPTDADAQLPDSAEGAGNYADDVAGPGRARAGTENRRGARALLVGCLAGLVLFLIVAGLHQALVRLGLQPTPQKTGLAAALESSWSVLVYHLIFTAAVTAILEEIFFRGCLQAFLQSRNMPPIVAIGFPALLFGLVHPVGVWPTLFGVGLSFGFLFWRYGLGSAILAHTVYNALLLLSRFLFQE
jgi:hypothetical protein